MTPERPGRASIYGDLPLLLGLQADSLPKALLGRALDPRADKPGSIRNVDNEAIFHLGLAFRASLSGRHSCLQNQREISCDKALAFCPAYFNLNFKEDWLRCQSDPLQLAPKLILQRIELIKEASIGGHSDPKGKFSICSLMGWF